ncbi:MAG: hypothetical protein CMH62_03455 [Nanoarchaeota archaeon]|nr:hypothetical protein [Nanoarchaeota archaeon]
MERKRINKLKLFSILVTTTFIFVVGIFFGQSISRAQLDEISNIQQDLRTQTLGLELQYALASQGTCDVPDLNTLGNELYDMSDTLARMENSLGKLNNDVLKLKEYYSLLEIKHWLFLKDFNENCKYDVPIILYFYSNLGDCDNRERQGYVLTYMKKRGPDINIFSFDLNLDNSVIKGLKKIYELEDRDLPVLIVGDEVYEGLRDADEIDSILSS